MQFKFMTLIFFSFNFQRIKYKSSVPSHSNFRKFIALLFTTFNLLFNKKWHSFKKCKLDNISVKKLSFVFFFQPFLKKIFKIIFIINLFACYSSSIWNIFEVQTSSFFNALYVVLIRICSNLQMSIFIIISGYNFSEVTSDLRKKKLEEASSINNNNQENNNNIVTSKAQVDRTV